ncbi:unnamed protein product [Linum tenue]|uniref:Sugar phosphate transporter domain-containing protein n=1 Tax=Linum tenue TaxID=586396 RepID=A0AAV0PBM8_9ROSI|nr:unnamed protein product [Linum tenue]
MTHPTSLYKPPSLPHPFFSRIQSSSNSYFSSSNQTSKVTLFPFTSPSIPTMNTKMMLPSLNRTTHPIFTASSSSSEFSPCIRRNSSTVPNFSPLPITHKPLHISSLRGRLTPSENKKSPTSTVCNAYEAGQPRPLDINIELPVVVDGEQAAQKIKIGIYFATWWALNVVFNIYNKKVLNAFPYPWLTSTLSLACGSLMMLVSWATRVADAPRVDSEFLKSLLPVAIAHTIGHVAATVSMSKVAVSFTHIIKSGEPAFSVLVSGLVLGETFPLPVYLSLLPIIGGCALAAITELNFNVIGFMGAMVSNLAFVFRNIFSKKGMKGKSISGMNYYACLSIMSLLILTPFAIAVEGPQMWAAGWQNAVAQIGHNVRKFFEQVGSGAEHLLPLVQSSVVHVPRSDISTDVQRREHDEEDLGHRLVDHHLPHPDPTRQRTRSRHRHLRHFPLLAGKSNSNRFFFSL